MIESIEPKGFLVQECSLPGEALADDVFPGHPNGIPLSQDRWLIVYCTRGWRSVDDDMSVVYQIRDKTPDGALIKEGMLAQSVDDWDPLGDGRQYVRQHGHPVAFGVPKGACFEGKPAAHANVFVAKWRVKAKGVVDPATGHIEPDAEAAGRTQDVVWCQFRLNDAGDDIEILQEPTPLRQKGFEEAEQICSHAEATHMNQAFSQAVPFNAFATEWVDCNHFHAGQDRSKAANSCVAPFRYRFNADRGLYEWVETGPIMFTSSLAPHEASIARVSSGWVIVARCSGVAAWVRTPDPFQEMPAAVFTSRPVINQPLTLYTCADGIPRLFTGDTQTSPYGQGRNPLYCWDVNPVTLETGPAHLIFDCVASGTLPNETIPRAEMGKLLPHMGGREQMVTWRVRTKNVNHPYGSLGPVTDEWKTAHGLYYAVITYDRDYKGQWEFDQ